MVEDPEDDMTKMPASITLPRQNGELLFESPWEARAFGLAVALNKEGKFPWKNFSKGLADHIRQSESGGSGAAYYEQWLKTLEALLIENGLLTADAIEIEAKAQARHDNHEH